MRELLAHLFTPRESNNHRARLLHHISILLLIVTFLFADFSFSFIHKQYPDVLGVANNISVDELVFLTNQQRASNGLAPLSLNAQLSSAAQMKGQDMLAKNYWAHNGPDGGTPWGFITSAGYNYIYAGENLARGFTTSGDTVNAWMESPGHRENMLSGNYKEVGFAVVTGTLTGDETVLVVQMFGSSTTGTPQITQAAQQIAVPTPMVVPTAVPPIVAIVPTVSPSPVITLVPTKQPTQKTPVFVASVQSKPLVNNETLSKNIALLATILFIVILTIDLIVIKKKKIIRVVSHNVDHIIFLSIIVVVILILTKGAVL